MTLFVVIAKATIGIIANDDLIIYNILEALSAICYSRVVIAVTKFFWERREPNPGQLGEEHERYICAMPPLHLAATKFVLRSLPPLILEPGTAG